MKDDLPIACELSSAEQRRRETAIRRGVARMAESVVESEDGIEAIFPGERGTLLGIAELVAMERECCRFLRFELVAEAGDGPIRLRIRGPDGTGEFLRSWFGQETGGRPETDRSSIARPAGERRNVKAEDGRSRSARRSSAVKALGEVALRVNDLARMKRFYREVLRLEPLREMESGALLRIAEGYGGHTQVLGLFDRSTPVGPERTTVDHIAFTIALEEYDRERARLRSRFGLEVEERTHAWIGWRSLYFHDPEGNLVELVCYDPALGVD